MKTLAFAFAIAALPLMAQETTTAAPPDDPLAALTQPKPKPDIVAIAREARAKKHASTKKPKVITNADLKKAKSQLKVHEIKPLSADEPSDSAQPPAASTITAQSEEAHYRAKTAAQGRVTVAEKRVADLEKELDLAEQAYYNENDPALRDDVVRKRFDQTKRQLEAARKELADARDALAAVK